MLVLHFCIGETQIGETNGTNTELLKSPIQALLTRAAGVEKKHAKCMSGQGHHLLDKGASADFYRDLKNAINQPFCQGLKSHPFKWQELFCQEFQIASMASPFGKGWQVSLHLQPTLLSRAGRPLFSGLQISPHPCQPRIGQLPAKNASGQLCRHATCCSCCRCRPPSPSTHQKVLGCGCLCSTQPCPGTLFSPR